MCTFLTQSGFGLWTDKMHRLVSWVTYCEMSLRNLRSEQSYNANKQNVKERGCSNGLISGPA